MKLDSIITIGKDELTKREWEKLLLKLTFRDADDDEISAFRYIPRRDVVQMPRGAWSLLPSHLEVDDRRSRPKLPMVEFVQTLDAPGYSGQKAAVAAMFEHEQGQVIAPPGVGKTQIGMAFAAACQTRTLVLVHTQDLFKQWLDRAAETCPDMEVGRIQGSTCEIGHVTIATAQTLKRYLEAGPKFWRQFGCILVDEAHHAAAETWEWLLNVCPAHYRFGVTASEKRSDGRQAMVRFNIGPVIFKVKFKSQVPMRVVPLSTKFHSKWNGTMYTRIIKQLVSDEDRNMLIAKVALEEIAEGNTVLILSRQIKHLENISKAMDWLQPNLQEREKWRIVTGKIARQSRDKYIRQMREGELQCILGTQLFEEGVDIPILNRIVLAYPGTEITALQKVGRGSRRYEGKTETIVYDLLDDLCRPLAKQYLRRRTWYKSVGIKVEKVRSQDDKKRKGKTRRTQAKKGRLGNRLYQVARPRR